MSDRALFTVSIANAAAGDGRRVAIKQLRAAVADREELIDRLRAEGSFLTTLRGGKGVLGVCGMLEQPFAIVLELAEGGSLSERLAREAISREDALRIFRDVSASVAHAHANGIIHRDIKPSNILFTAAGETRLSDFGIAVRRGARSTAEGWDDIDVGTLGSAAPELLHDPSTANTEAVDIYGLGALLHELLLGAPPHMMHGAETEADLRARIVAGATRDLTARESELSPSHRRLLDAALAPDSATRPQSVAELLALLDAP
jgi:serine/threonine protein kinase